MASTGPSGAWRPRTSTARHLYQLLAGERALDFDAAAPQPRVVRMRSVSMLRHAQHVGMGRVELADRSGTAGADPALR